MILKTEKSHERDNFKIRCYYVENMNEKGMHSSKPLADLWK